MQILDSHLSNANPSVLIFYVFCNLKLELEGVFYNTNFI